MLKKLLLTVICLPLFISSVIAAEMKVAVVEMDKVFQGYYKTKQTDALLKQKQGIYQAWSKKLGESRLKLQEEFKILRDASQNIALSSAEREKKRLAAQNKYQEFKKKEAELEQYIQQKSREYKDLVEKMHKKLLDEIYIEIRRYAVLKGYSFVFDKSGKTLNNIPVIIYSSDQFDISEEILENLNRGQPDAEAQSDKGSSLR
jgi:outer membrane protein